MARSIWSGVVSFGLVSVPVALYSATREHEVTFHQFEQGTTDRIRNKRVNERTGKEVDYGEVVKGAEVNGGRYVMLEQSELESVAPGRSRSLDIHVFVDLDEIDPIYYQKSYYLGPGSDETVKTYALLRDAMAEANRAAIGTLVMRGKQYLATIRPKDDILVLETMYFADEIRDPQAGTAAGAGQGQAGRPGARHGGQAHRVDVGSVGSPRSSATPTPTGCRTSSRPRARAWRSPPPRRPPRRPTSSTSWRRCGPASTRPGNAVRGAPSRTAKKSTPAKKSTAAKNGQEGDAGQEGHASERAPRRRPRPRRRRRRAKKSTAPKRATKTASAKKTAPRRRRGGRPEPWRCRRSGPCWPRPANRPTRPAGRTSSNGTVCGPSCRSTQGRVSIVSRNDRDVTPSYPDLAGVGQHLAGRSVVLDGEIVATDAQGRPSFSLLQRRMHVVAPSAALLTQVPVRLYVFDLLYLDGDLLLPHPYRERRARLEALGLDDASRDHAAGLRRGQLAGRGARPPRPSWAWRASWPSGSTRRTRPACAPSTGSRSRSTRRSRWSSVAGRPARGAGPAPSAPCCSACTTTPAGWSTLDRSAPASPNAC